MAEQNPLRARAEQLSERIHKILHEFTGRDCRPDGGWCDARDHAEAILAAFEDVTREARRAAYVEYVRTSTSDIAERIGRASSEETTGARPRLEPENVLSSPMAAGLLVKLKEECKAQHERAEAAEQALRNLVQAIDEMSNDEQYKAAFLALYVHGFAYSGRQIVTELEAAKAVLAATRPPGAPTP